MAEFEKQFNPAQSHNEIDIITSIAFFWRIRLYFVGGLLAGAVIAFILSLPILKVKADAASGEIFLVPSMSDVEGIVPAVESIENFLFSPEGNKVFLEAVKNNLGNNSNLSDAIDAKYFISGLDYDDKKNLKVSLTLKNEDYIKSIPGAVSEGINEVIRVRNASTRAKFLELDSQYYLAMQKYTKSSYDLMRMAQKWSKPNDPVFLALLAAVVAEGVSLRAVDKMSMLVNSIPDSEPGKLKSFNEFRQSHLEVQHAKETIDASRASVNPLINLQIWKPFEFRGRSTIARMNQDFTQTRMIKLIFVGMVAGGLLGSIWGSLYSYWRTHQKRIQMVFQKQVSQK